MRFSRLKKRIPDALFHAHTRIRAFLHFKCFSKGGNCPDAFFRAQKTHPGISPFQMLLEGWELPRCVFRGSKNAFQIFLHFKCFLKGGSCPDAFFPSSENASCQGWSVLSSNLSNAFSEGKQTHWRNSISTSGNARQRSHDTRSRTHDRRQLRLLDIYPFSIFLRESWWKITLCTAHWFPWSKKNLPCKLTYLCSLYPSFLSWHQFESTTRDKKTSETVFESNGS